MIRQAQTSHCNWLGCNLAQLLLPKFVCLLLQNLSKVFPQDLLSFSSQLVPLGFRRAMGSCHQRQACFTQHLSNCTKSSSKIKMPGMPKGLYKAFGRLEADISITESVVSSIRKDQSLEKDKAVRCISYDCLFIVKERLKLGKSLWKMT